MVPADPVLEVGGAVAEQLALPLRELKTLPRAEVVADFHCVAGWSVTGLRWEGITFAAFHRDVLASRAVGNATHVKFVGLDGDHGAPLRLISPGQYGFINTKHLWRIELLTAESPTCIGSASTEAPWAFDCSATSALSARLSGTRSATGSSHPAGPGRLAAAHPGDPQAQRPPLTRYFVTRRVSRA